MIHGLNIFVNFCIRKRLPLRDFLIVKVTAIFIWQG